MGDKTDILKIHKKVRQMIDIANSHLENTDEPYHSQAVGRCIALNYLRHWLEEEFLLDPSKGEE